MKQNNPKKLSNLNQLLEQYNLREELSLNDLYKSTDLKRKFRSGDIGAVKLVRKTPTNYLYGASLSSDGSKAYVIKLSFPEDADEITTKLPIQVKCTCSDFKYRMAYALNKNDAHTGDGGLELTKAPNITNPKQKPYICKHIYALVQDLITKGIIKRMK